MFVVKRFCGERNHLVDCVHRYAEASKCMSVDNKEVAVVKSTATERIEDGAVAVR